MKKENGKWSKNNKFTIYSEDAAFVQTRVRQGNPKRIGITFKSKK